MNFSVRRRFPVALLVVFVAAVGCETTDYEPLRVKKELKDLREEVETLRAELEQIKSGAVPTQAAPSETKVVVAPPPEKRAETEPETPPAVDARETLTLEQEQEIVAQLERVDAYFAFDDDGYVVEADFKDCRQQQDALQQVVDFGRLSKILLSGNDMNEESFELLSKITSVEYLDLERSVPSVESMEKLKQLPNLKFLQLLRATLSADVFKVMSEFPALEQIRCAQTRVGDEELAYLENLQTLRAIDLSDCNRVSTKGLESLVKCPRLSFLKVWGKSINDQSMDVVAKMQSLKVLGLTDSSVGDEGIAKLADLKLSEIQLFRTSVGDEGIKILAQMPSMTKMNLRDTAISDQAIDYISELEKLTVLDVSECNSPGVTDEGLKKIAEMKSLEQLNLWSTKVTDAGVAELAGLSNLTWLNLDNTEVTDETAKLISEKMQQLTWLHLGKTKVSDEGVKLLEDMDNLTYLALPATISDNVFFDLLDKLAENDCFVERSSL